MRATDLLIAGPCLAASLIRPASTTAQVDLVHLFETSNPAVVVVSAYASTGVPLSQGSGFIIDPKGTVVTNRHVILDADVVVIRRPDAAPAFAVSVLRTSEEWDLALLKTTEADLPSLALASPGDAKVGTHVIAIGSPLGLENTISEGIISGIREGSLLQVTTPISPGSSGGALLSTSGSVLGVTTLTVTGGQNINFAVPADKVRALMRSATGKPAERALSSLDKIPDPRSKGTTDARYQEAFRKEIESSCPEVHEVDQIIAETISVGAPIYNAGSPMGCYRIYEGASYKMLYLLGDRCSSVTTMLNAGLSQAQADTSSTDKAWTLRRTFDLILGEPTRYK